MAPTASTTVDTFGEHFLKLLSGVPVLPLPHFLWSEEGRGLWTGGGGVLTEGVRLLS